eukprot:7127799-Ditylum_brightwellii.AAC.1
MESYIYRLPGEFKVLSSQILQVEENISEIIYIYSQEGTNLVHPQTAIVGQPPGGIQECNISIQKADQYWQTKQTK